MKNITKFLMVFAMAALFVFSMASCDSPIDPPDEPDPDPRPERDVNDWSEALGTGPWPAGRTWSRVSIMADSERIYWNGKLVDIEELDESPPAFIDEDGVFMIPIALVDVALGTNVSIAFDEEEGEITITQGSTTLLLEVDGTTLRSGSNTFTLETAPQVIDDVLFLPLAQITPRLSQVWFATEPVSGVIVVTSGVTAPGNQDGTTNGNMHGRADTNQWMGSQEAIRMADMLLLWQRFNGGWPEDTTISTAELEDWREYAIVFQKNNVDASIDNNGTMN